MMFGFGEYLALRRVTLPLQDVSLKIVQDNGSIDKCVKWNFECFRTFFLELCLDRYLGSC